MSRTFLKVFSDFLKVFQPPQNPHKLLLWAFQRLPLAGQLDYITTGSRTLSTGFLNFSTNFGRNFWAVCILWWVGVLAQVVEEGGVCRKIARASNARPYKVVVLYCPVERGDLTPPCKWAVTAKRQGGVKTVPCRLAVRLHCRGGCNGRHLCRPYG